MEFGSGLLGFERGRHPKLAGYGWMLAKSLKG
jgi:hypothetical protein